jgi:hypothetical protein
MGQIDPQLLERLLYIFIGLIALIIIALVVYLILSGRQIRAAAEARRREAQIPIRASLEMVGQILSLVRVEAGGPLEVEIDGVRYRRLSDVADPQIKRRIVDAAMELIQFTGVLGIGAIEPAPIEKTETWREDLRQGSQSELQQTRAAPPGAGSPPQTSAEVEEQFLSMLAEMGQPPPQPEKPGVISAVRQRMAPKLPEPERPRTFVDEIEEIVQRRLPLIPALAGRGLHIRPGQAGKVLFLFDGQEYDNVDDIPNLTARQLVKDAIREWDETT